MADKVLQILAKNGVNLNEVKDIETTGLFGLYKLTFHNSAIGHCKLKNKQDIIKVNMVLCFPNF